VKRSNTVLRTSQNRKRSRSVVQSIRLSLDERKRLRFAARSAGMSVSDYVRAALQARKSYRGTMTPSAWPAALAEAVGDEPVTLNGKAVRK